MPEITVGMMTYNRINTLPKAVEAIRQQSFTDWELIIVNNGSSDSRVAKYCQSICREDKRIKYAEVYPNNIPKAYQTILELATGTYYTQMDDDDDCDTDLLAFLYNLAESYEADIAMCGSYRMMDDKAVDFFVFDTTLLMNKIQALNALMDRKICSTAVWSKLFKREKVIGKTAWSDYHKQGDAATVYKWFAHADKVVAHGLPKYYYRQPQNEIGTLQDYVDSHNLSPQLIDDYLQIFADRTAYLQEHVPEVAWRARCAEWAFMLSMCEKITSLHKDNCRQQYDYMKQTILANREKIGQCNCFTQREQTIFAGLQQAQ